MPLQIRRTSTPDNPPTGLEQGQLAVEMANDPPRLWVGVPTSIDPTGRRQLLVPEVLGAKEATMVFYQPAAPVGWVLVNQHDRTLRVVNSAGGGLGGTTGFSIINARTQIGAHTLSAAQIPALSLQGYNYIQVWPEGNTGAWVPFSSSYWAGAWFDRNGGTVVTYTTGSVVSQNFFATYPGIGIPNFGLSGTSSNPHSHGVTMNIAYLDVILATRQFT